MAPKDASAAPAHDDYTFRAEIAPYWLVMPPSDFVIGENGWILALLRLRRRSAHCHWGGAPSPGAPPLDPPLVWGDGFIGTQTHLPPKLNFSSDFGHFILKMVVNAKLSCVKKKDRIYKKKDLLKYHNFWGDVPR